MQQLNAQSLCLKIKTAKLNQDSGVKWLIYAKLLLWVALLIANNSLREFGSDHHHTGGQNLKGLFSKNITLYSGISVFPMLIFYLNLPMFDLFPFIHWSSLILKENLYEVKRVNFHFVLISWSVVVFLRENRLSHTCMLQSFLL